MTELNLLYGGDNLLNDNTVDNRKDSVYSSKISGQQLHQLAMNNDHNGIEEKQMIPPPQSQSMQIAQQQLAMQQMAQQQNQQIAQSQNNEQIYKRRNE